MLTPSKPIIKPLKIAIVNEICTAGATRCARDLEHALAQQHTVRYYPREHRETKPSLLNDLHQFQPDVVHCHSYYGDLPYHLLSILSQTYPTCFTPHDPRPIGTIATACWDCSHNQWCLRCPLRSHQQNFLYRNPYFWQRLRRRYTHWKSASTLRIVTASQWLQQRLRSTELRRFEIRHIPYGIDLDRFRRIPNARHQLGLPEDPPIILYSAHPNQAGWHSNSRKGLRYVAEAFVEVIIPRLPEALLLVAGERLAPNHPNVRPLGFLAQDELPTYYSAADIFAAPTLADNLPYTILEAMACETPVVASRIGGVPEEVDHGKTGLLVPPADSLALGHALFDVLSDPQKQHFMGQNGRKRAQRLFNMETFIQRHETLYQTITT